MPLTNVITRGGDLAYGNDGKRYHLDIADPQGILYTSPASRGLFVGEVPFTIQTGEFPSASLSVDGAGRPSVVFAGIIATPGRNLYIETVRDPVGGTLAHVEDVIYLWPPFGDIYSHVTHTIDPARGLCVALARHDWSNTDNNGTQEWRIITGQATGSGTNSGFGSWTTPAPISIGGSAPTGIRRQARLRRATDGSFWFAWLDLGGVPRIARCSSLSPDGTSTWGSAATIDSGAWNGIAFTLCPYSGRNWIVALLRSSANGYWYVTVGEVDASGAVGSFSTPTQQIADAYAGADSSIGNVVERPDGAFEFVLRAPTQEWVCKDLTDSGGGTWA